MLAEDLIKIVKKNVQLAATNPGINGLSSGFVELDKLTCGWQNSELITIGGRPGMGKTSLALSMLKNIAVDSKISSLFFSIESTSVNVLQKIISAETGINIEKIRKGLIEKHEWEILNVKSYPIEKAPLFIDDTPEIYIDELINKIVKLKSEKDIKIVFIDYLQLIRVDPKKYLASNREQEISIIVKKLKATSKSLDIPIILFSQLNRNLEERHGTKRPQMTDLRDSGTIGEDSDLVFFIYRPEYYKIDEWDDYERSPTEGQAELLLVKNRSGKEGKIRLKFIDYLNKFENLEEIEEDTLLTKNDVPF